MDFTAHDWAEWLSCEFNLHLHPVEIGSTTYTHTHPAEIAEYYNDLS